MDEKKLIQDFRRNSYRSKDLMDLKLKELLIWKLKN